MILKYLIIVEGIADIIFLRDYLKFLLKIKDLNLELKLEKEIDLKGKETEEIKAIILLCQALEIKILKIEGYSGIKKAKNQIQEEVDLYDYKVLVIQDADNSHNENGGVEKRMKYLNDIKEEVEFVFETFLFPNHEEDGELETLLLQIVNIEEYNKSNKCYVEYIECIKKISKEKASKNLEKDKSLIFNYFRTYYGIKSAKESNRNYEEKFWNFNSVALKPLKKFMEASIKL